VDRRERPVAESFRAQRIGAVALGICVLVEVLLLGSSNWTTGARSVTGTLENGSPNVNVLGQSLFTTYLLPFEVTSALLVVAVVGAVVLARRHERGDPREPELGQREAVELADQARREATDPDPVDAP